MVAIADLAPVWKHIGTFSGALHDFSPGWDHIRRRAVKGESHDGNFHDHH